MVFLQDIVDIPPSELANILIAAAHIQAKKLSKKQVKKTNLTKACSALQSAVDKSKTTEKELKLQHAAQCLVGISWLHFKQVEFLHSDCNEAFSKLKIAFRKRKVDLEPSGPAPDINLPQRNDDEEVELILQLPNADLDQMFNDNASDIGSLMGSHGNVDPFAAEEHEITMPEQHRSPRRSSFGGQSSIFGNLHELMNAADNADLDLFDDDDSDNDVLDESLALRTREDEMAGLTDIDENESIEHRRAFDGSFIPIDNLSDIGSAIPGDLASVVSDTNFSEHFDLHKQKDNTLPMLDNISIGTGSMVNLDLDIQDDAMDVDNPQLIADLVDTTSIATALLQEQRAQNEATPPASPSNNKQKANGKAKKKKKSKKSRRFARDSKIEIAKQELYRTMNENSPRYKKAHRRDSTHIWKEPFLGDNTFKHLLENPISFKDYKSLPNEITETFRLINLRFKPKGKTWGANKTKLGTFQLAETKARDMPACAGQDYPPTDDEGLVQSDNEQNHDIHDNNNDDHEVHDDVVVHDEVVEQGRNDNEFDVEIDPMISDAFPPMQDSMSNLAIDDRHSFSASPLRLDLSKVSIGNKSILDCVVDDSIAPPLYMDSINQITLDPINESLPQLQLPEHEEDDDDDVDNDDDDIMKDKDVIVNEAAATETSQTTNVELIKAREWSRRTKKTFHYFKHKAEKEFSFDQMMNNTNDSYNVASMFYELLVFKNYDLVDLKQSTPFDDINIIKTTQFEKHSKVSHLISQHATQSQQN